LLNFCAFYTKIGGFKAARGPTRKLADPERVLIDGKRRRCSDEVTEVLLGARDAA
jgi:hypothetical protein